MKLTNEQQKKLNDFARKYLAKSPNWNWIRIRSGGKKHQARINEICLDLDYELNTPFATEVEFKTGYRPDIICPLHIKPIIEVRFSETDKETKKKYLGIPRELQDEIIYIDARKPYKLKDIL